jgi:hypothetical protein
LLRHDGRIELAHNKAAIGIPEPSADNVWIFLSRDNRNCRIGPDRRHGFVRLSPCFSRVLAPVSAESRHEAKQFFMLRSQCADRKFWELKGKSVRLHESHASLPSQSIAASTAAMPTLRR